mgnify:CR=1 FL=1
MMIMEHTDEQSIGFIKFSLEFLKWNKFYRLPVGHDIMSAWNVKCSVGFKRERLRLIILISKPFTTTNYINIFRK